LAIELSKYLAAKRPATPLGLIPEDVLKHIVEGFCSRLDAGVTIVYPEGELSPAQVAGAEPAQFQRTDAPSAPQKYHAFCRAFRETPGGDDACRECDRRRALRYWQASSLGPDVYPCHMGMIDMTYPLLLRGQMVAVAFAGQVLNDAGLANMRTKALQDAASRDSLLALLADEKGCPRLGRADLRERIAEFEAFGAMLQELLRSMYEAQWNAARREFLGEVSRELTAAPAANLEAWSAVLGSVLGSFAALVGLGGVKVYSRRRSRYELWGRTPAGVDSTADDQFPVKYAAQIEPGKLVPLADVPGAAGLRQQARLACDEIDVFVDEYREQLQLALDTLIVVWGPVDPADREFIQEFCEIIANRVRVMRLVVTLQEERAKFEERVGHVGHTAKTPLQAALGVVADIQRRPDIPVEVGAQARTCGRNIAIAAAYMRGIYSGPTHHARDADLRGVVQRVVNDFGEVAASRQCGLLYEVDSLYNPQFRDQGTLGIAITNLLDNATKYSAPGREVLIRLTRLTSGLAVIVVENTGQGIPDADVSRIRDHLERYEPPDLPSELRERREGGGIGLAMADRFVEEHGGWLDIKSYPLGERHRDDPRDHWRTVVTVAVPRR